MTLLPAWGTSHKPTHSFLMPPLAQVASLDAKEFDPQFEQLYKVFIGQLAQIVPPANDIPQLFKDSEDAQVFIQNLAIFMTGFFKVSAAPKMSGSKGVGCLCLCEAVVPEQCVHSTSGLSQERLFSGRCPL